MHLTKHGDGACIQIADHEAEVARLRAALEEQATAGTLDPQRIMDLIRERDALIAEADAAWEAVTRYCGALEVQAISDYVSAARAAAALEEK